MDTYTNNNWSAGNAGDINLPETIALMKKWIARDNLRRSRTEFAVMAMDACHVCGEKIEYRESPEAFIVCSHILHELRQRCEVSDKAWPGLSLSGIRIEVKLAHKVSARSPQDETSR